MPRSADLLKLAAEALEDHRDPFSTSWLAENGVTFDECMNLGESLALGARLLAWLMEHPQEAAAALNGARLATASRLLTQALERWKPNQLTEGVTQ